MYHTYNTAIIPTSLPMDIPQRFIHNRKKHWDKFSFSLKNDKFVRNVAIISTPRDCYDKGTA